MEEEDVLTGVNEGISNNTSARSSTERPMKEDFVFILSVIFPDIFPKLLP